MKDGISREFKKAYHGYSKMPFPRNAKLIKDVECDVPRSSKRLHSLAEDCGHSGGNFNTNVNLCSNSK